MKKVTKRYLIVGLGLLFVALPALAAPESLTDTLDRVTGVFPAVQRVAVLLLALMGTIYAGFGVMELRKLGVSNGMSQMNYRNPFLGIIVGISLIYFTTMVGIGGVTVFGQNAKAVDIKSKTIEFQ